MINSSNRLESDSSGQKTNPSLWFFKGLCDIEPGRYGIRHQKLSKK